MNGVNLDEAAKAHAEHRGRMTDITQLLRRAESGDEDSLQQVFAELYPELRRIAQARLMGDSATLTPTVLVHDVYLKLTTGEPLSLESRKHFYACAARAMRMILVDHARSRGALKRGGDQQHMTLNELAVGTAGIDLEVLALDRALDQLELRDLRQAEVVKLHCFGGMNFAEIAELMACSERTTKRYWSRARAYLHLQMEGV